MKGASDVEALCRLMQEYGVTRLTLGDLVLERPLSPPKPAGRIETELERLQKAPVDTQDARLMLGHRGVSGR